MINRETLLTHSYKEFEDKINPYADFFYQKDFRNSGGTIKYFVNFIHYPENLNGLQETFKLDLRMNSTEKTPMMTFETHFCNNLSLEDLEYTVENVWKAVGEPYYD